MNTEVTIPKQIDCRRLNVARGRFVIGKLIGLPALNKLLTEV